MPWPAPPRQVPSPITPHHHLCCGTLMSSTQSSRVTSDMPSDPSAPLQGCSRRPRPLGPCSVTYHPSENPTCPTPSSFERAWCILSRDRMKMEWTVGRGERNIKSSSRWELHLSALGGCQLPVSQEQGGSRVSTGGYKEKRCSVFQTISLQYMKEIATFPKPAEGNSRA